MDKFQHKLRLLIVTGSAVGFIGGWGMLAHSGKPVTDQPVDDTANQTEAAPIQLAAPTPIQLPPLDFKALESAGGSSNLQVLPGISSVPNTQSVPTFRPRVRTRSS
ncbi:MAG TPA: hypothetical protein VFF59_06975 [Anaerolineae bacterium]|nr:hypothetical protein [Anaerolineae bacterium]